MIFSWWTAFWVSYILLGVVADITADRNERRYDTLTEHLRWWLSIRQRPGRGVWFRRMVALSFFAWIVPHLFGWL